MFIFQIDPGKILQAQNTGGTSKSIDAPDAALLKSLSANKPGWIDPGPVLHPPFLPEKLLGEIIDLSNALLMDPYHHLGEISKLGKDLAEYTHTEYNLGKVDKLFDFFLRDKSDLTGDGKIDHNDVIAFWHSLDKPVTKGDINDDGKINQKDVKDLKHALGFGDMNSDGKLDGKDYQLLQEFLETPPLISPRPPSRLGDVNNDGHVDQKDLKRLEHILSAGDMDNDGKVAQADLKILTDRVDDPLTTIKDLSKGLLEDPYHHLIDIPTLGKALAKYTNTEYDLGKADKLFDFFLRTKSDLTGDGIIDYKDVMVYWKDLDKPFVALPPVVHLDFGNDKKTDYYIHNGKMYQIIDDYIKEVDHIEGVNLKELVEEIQKHMADSSSTEFQFDINHDGKIDNIFASNITTLAGQTTPQQQVNNRPMGLD